MATKFIFDLDGTVTSQETLPLIARHFNVQDEIEHLTTETINGNVPFIESFIRRVFILGKLPVNEVDKLLSTVSLYDKVLDFIHKHQDDCIIATGNLGCWVNELSHKIDCTLFCSDCVVRDNRVSRLTKILRKEQVVFHFKSLGHKVIFVGEGNNDVEAMRSADVSIASGLTHYPANSVLSITDYVIFDEVALCRQLSQLL